MVLTFDVHEVMEFGDKLTGAQLGEGIAEGVNAVAALGMERMIEFAPVKFGTLRGSIRMLHTASAGSLSAEYGTDVEYAFMREYGGTITARNAPFLVFQVGGHWVRVKSVTQSGTHYAGRSRDAIAPLAAEIIGRAVMRAIASL